MHLSLCSTAIGVGTPDSGIEEASSQAVQAPSPLGQDASTSTKLPAPDATLLSEEDKAAATKRPASSFTGLRRGQLESMQEHTLL